MPLQWHGRCQVVPISLETLSFFMHTAMPHCFVVHFTAMHTTCTHPAGAWLPYTGLLPLALLPTASLHSLRWVCCPGICCCLLPHAHFHGMYTSCTAQPPPMDVDDFNICQSIEFIR